MIDCCYLPLYALGLFAAVVLAYLVLRWFFWQLRVGNYAQKYVLITGCDMGFGNLLAKRLTKMGFNVFAGCLTERGISDLEEVGNKKLKAFLLDVTRKEDIERVKRLVKEWLPRDQGLWGLVNNAGILGPLGFPDCCKREDYEKVLDVNMYGTIDMSIAFLPLLRQAEGRLVNVASVAGMVSMPCCIPYNISKYGVEAFSDGLRYSTYNQKVSVHMLEPGLHGTQLLNQEVLMRGMSKDFHSAPQEVQDYYGEQCLENYSWFVCKLLNMITSSRLHKVIDAHIHAITARFPKTRYLVGYDANFIFWPIKVMPDWFGNFLLKSRFCDPIGLQKKKTS